MRKINLLSLIYFFGAFLCAQSAYAVSDACHLKQTPLPTEQTMSEVEIADYRNKLEAECAWKQRYDYFRQQINQLYQFDSDRVSEYQAMRFIRRVDFETSKKFEVPVEVTYQVNRSQYNLPNEQKSRVIWDNWILGMRQLPAAKQFLQQGNIFDVNKLKEIHVGFFQLSTETGDFAVQPHQGRFKSPQMQDNYWWELKPEETAQSKRIIEQINEHYRQMRLLPNFTEPYLNKILDIRTTVKRQTDPSRKNVVEYIEAIYSGQTRANPTHVQNILGFMNSMVQQALQNRHMIWNGKLMTPAETAYLVQKFFVAVHPFHEGNGRTSRFLQELVLTTLNMPHGSSGDLMDSDVITTFEDYYDQAMQANANLMNTLQNCLIEYRTLNGINPATAQQGLLNYSCRVLQNQRP